MNINKRNIAKLQEWISNPTDDLNKYQSVVGRLRMTDLVFLMTSQDVTLARIAWVEFGRRRGLAALNINLYQVGDTVELQYEGGAVPMAHTVTLDT